MRLSRVLLISVSTVFLSSCNEAGTPVQATPVQATTAAPASADNALAALRARQKQLKPKYVQLRDNYKITAEQLKSKRAELAAAKAANDKAVIASAAAELNSTKRAYRAARASLQPVRKEWKELRAQIKAAKVKP